MRRGLRLAAISLSMLLLAACASVTSIPYDRTAAGINSIAILEPQMPEKATVYEAADLGMSFGLIGALIDSGIQSNRQKKLADVVEANNFSAKDVLIHAVDEALQARGYSFVAVPVERTKDDFMATYPDAPDGSQALLDLVVVEYGYLKAGAGKNAKWRPHVLLKARLVRASDKAVLMESWFNYNPVNKTKGMVTVAPDPNFGYEDVDELIAGQTETLNGIQQAFAKTTDAMGTLLQ